MDRLKILLWNRTGTELQLLGFTVARRSAAALSERRLHRRLCAIFLRIGWGYDRRDWGKRAIGMVDFKGSHFERDVTLWGVRWYVACPMSYRQLEEMMEERGVEVGYSTLNRWVVKYAPLLENQFRAGKRAVGSIWRLDETCVKVKGYWKYLYRQSTRQAQRWISC
jgi:hypothetical protein